MIKPLPHQELILQELKDIIKALIVIPSGAGKTHTAAFYIDSIEPKSFIYVVHRNEILVQTVKIFKEICQFMNNDNIGIINEDRKEFEKPYLFATIQTVTKEKNLEQLQQRECIVIDEAHHVAAKTYQRFLSSVKYNILLGLTATPDRHDKQDIKKHFDNNVLGNIDIYTGIEQKILVPFYYIGFWDNINYDNIEHNGYKYKEFDLDKSLLIAKRNLQIIQEYKNHIEPENRLTIAFCNSVNHVQKMTELFNAAGIPSRGLWFRHSSQDRKIILDEFRKGKYKVLFTRDILNEGVDFPECSAIMLLRPTYSKTIFLQQLGRGLRTQPGKNNVMVLDFLGNYINAFMIKEYLKEITRAEPGIYSGERKKPIYNMTIPIVKFDSRVIDMMELQITAGKQRLPDPFYQVDKIKKYFDEVLPKEPPFTSTSKFNSQDKKYWYCYPMLLKAYGSYFNFLKETGRCDGIMDHYPFWSLKHFKHDYELVKSIVKRVPKRVDFHTLSRQQKIRIGTNSIKSVFGSFENFVIKMGDDPNKYFKRVKNRKIFTEPELLKIYHDYKKNHNYGPNDIPRSKDLDKEYPGFYNSIVKVYNRKYTRLVEIAEQRDHIILTCEYCKRDFKKKLGSNNRKFCSIDCIKHSTYNNYRKKNMLLGKKSIKRKSRFIDYKTE